MNIKKKENRKNKEKRKRKGKQGKIPQKKNTNRHTYV